MDAYRYGASPYGVLDLSGNVWEWMRLLYRPYPYVAEDGREDPQLRDFRVWRGGSWDDDHPLDRNGSGGWCGVSRPPSLLNP